MPQKDPNLPQKRPNLLLLLSRFKSSQNSGAGHIPGGNQGLSS
jgi:hypothetical protein